MADVVLSVPLVERLSPNFFPGRELTRGIVIHATRGPGNRTLATEYANTVAFFAQRGPVNNRRPSAHVVVGPSEVTRIVHDDDMAWHAIENNETHLGIEVAQPATEPDFVDFQYAATAELCRKWCAKYEIPPRRVFSQFQVGIIGHEDAEQGRRSGKSDPGRKWDWDRFVRLLLENPDATDTRPRFAFNIGPDFEAFLVGHPKFGLPRQDAWTDSFGNMFVWCTATEKHPKGALLVWRKWLNQVRPLAWD